MSAAARLREVLVAVWEWDRRHQPSTPVAAAVTLVLAASLLSLAVAGCCGLRNQGPSMGDTLPGEDRLLLVVPAGQYEVGDIVAADAPGGVVVKRIVAVEGQTLAVCDWLVRDGVPVLEPYLSGGPGIRFDPILVPTETVILLGDNRENSEDSRTFGPVPIDQIRGRVVAQLWPPSTIATYDVDPLPVVASGCDG